MNKNPTRINARSKKDGIIFYSSTVPFLGMETYIDNSGNLQSRFIPSDSQKYFDYESPLNKEATKVKKWKVVIFNILLILASIVAFIVLKNFGFILAAIFFSVFVSSDLFDFVKKIYEYKSKNGKKYSTGKFHAAEHMVINAYEKLERIPTIEEIKNFSRFHKRCGSNITTFKIIIFSLYCIALIFSSINAIVYFILLLLIAIFMFVALKYGLLNFLQILVTNKPSDKELELAIEGLLQFEVMEENLENNFFISIDFLI